jgi:AcrR family transcriptional regulator
LLTAHDLFYRDGIRATGIDRVIAESGVAKVTFYRHFPSKNDLILAFLAHRHQRWMAWFDEALNRHGNTPHAVVPTLAEWFSQATFRGCAFINSLSELGASMPDVVSVVQHHKTDVVARLAKLLPPDHGADVALTLALTVDGAIVRAQFDSTPDAALAGLRCMLDAWLPTAITPARTRSAPPPADPVPACP